MFILVVEMNKRAERSVTQNLHEMTMEKRCASKSLQADETE